MGSVPLVAPMIRQQIPDWQTTMMRALQMQDMMGKSQLYGAEAQRQQFALQQGKLEMADDQKIRAAMQNWDDGNPDTLKMELRKQQVGFKAYKDVTDWLDAQQKQHNQLDAQTNQILQEHYADMGNRIDSVLAQPAAKRQAAWAEQVQWAHAQPWASQMGLTLPEQLPDEDWLTLHRNVYLGAEKSAAQALAQKETTARTAQIEQQTRDAAGKSDPTSPLYSPTPQAVSLGVRQENPTMQDIAAGEAQQVGAKAGAEAAAKFPWEARLEQMRQQGDPVFAYDPQSKQTVQVSRAQAQQAGYTNIVKVGQPEIDKAKTSAMQLGDATMNIQAYKQASQRMDELSGSDIATVSRVLGDSQFKAHFLGAELPTDWANELYRAKGWQDMPESAKDAVVNYLAARPAAISLLRAINPGVRLTESQIATELKNIPDPTVPSDIRDRQFARLDRNIDQASKTLVKIPGVDLPSEIRDRLASQAGAEDAVRARAAAQQNAATGQYRNAKGNRMQVGQEAYDTSKRYIGTVSKVYADGSYDVDQAGVR